MINNNQPLRIALAGFGTVGAGLAQLLLDSADVLRARCGRSLKIKRILVRDAKKARPLGFPDSAHVTTNPDECLADDIDVFVELIGGTTLAKELIIKALTAGKHVVTANKALLAEHGQELFALAAEKGVALAYEASTAGGIPIVQTLRESLAGNNIESIMGILNGTGNYILSEMTGNGITFEKALAQAQELGFAEADPTLDVEGFDTAHKLVLLVRLALGVHYPLEKLTIQGITSVEPVDINFARELGFRIKLLAQMRVVDGKVDAAVSPALVREGLLLARVGGAYNAVHIKGSAIGTLFLHGLGAGSLPTASAVAADLIAIANQTYINNTGFLNNGAFPEATILGAEQAKSAYYLRLIAPDQPGVLRDIAGILAESNISIAQAIQRKQDEFSVPLVFMTHETSAKAMADACQKLAASPKLTLKAPVCFRMVQ